MSTKYYKLGLIGYPIEHSYSQILHTAALNACNLFGEYRLYQIPDLPEGIPKIKSLINTLKKQEIVGLNVTIPHKTKIVNYLDALNPTSRLIGAVNTIYLQNGLPTGTNTDAVGFLNDLKIQSKGYLEIDQHQNNSLLHNAHALILGAGGAARAVAYSLLGVGWDVSIAARKMERARSLAEALKLNFKNKKIKAVELSYSGLAEIGQRYALIVNATAAGMHPDVMSSPWPAGLNLPERSFVYDLVYNPGMTELLKQAREENIPASGGIGMLIEQAALSFQIWTGLSISRDVMYDSIKDIT